MYEDDDNLYWDDEQQRYYDSYDEYLREGDSE